MENSVVRKLAHESFGTWAAPFGFEELRAQPAISQWLYRVDELAQIYDLETMKK